MFGWVEQCALSKLKAEFQPRRVVQRRAVLAGAWPKTEEEVPRTEKGSILALCTSLQGQVSHRSASESPLIPPCATKRRKLKPLTKPSCHVN